MRISRIAISSAAGARVPMSNDSDRMMAENAEIEIGNKLSSYEKLESKNVCMNCVQIQNL